jgi:hypothetical protein
LPANVIILIYFVVKTVAICIKVSITVPEHTATRIMSEKRSQALPVGQSCENLAARAVGQFGKVAIALIRERPPQIGDVHIIACALKVNWGWFEVIVHHKYIALQTMRTGPARQLLHGILFADESVEFAKVAEVKLPILDTEVLEFEFFPPKIIDKIK